MKTPFKSPADYSLLRAGVCSSRHFAVSLVESGAQFHFTRCCSASVPPACSRSAGNILPGRSVCRCPVPAVPNGTRSPPPRLLAPARGVAQSSRSRKHTESAPVELISIAFVPSSRWSVAITTAGASIPSRIIALTSSGSDQWQVSRQNQDRITAPATTCVARISGVQFRRAALLYRMRVQVPLHTASARVSRLITSTPDTCGAAFTAVSTRRSISESCCRSSGESTAARRLFARVNGLTGIIAQTLTAASLSSSAAWLSTRRARACSVFRLLGPVKNFTRQRCPVFSTS